MLDTRPAPPVLPASHTPAPKNDLAKLLSVAAILVTAIGQILVTLDDSDEA